MTESALESTKENNVSNKVLTPDWIKAGLEKQKPVFKKPPTLIGDAFIGVHPGVFEVRRPIQHFITGSSYDGTWDVLGFSGYGTYYYPHGAIYQGNFKNGQFHGRGQIIYPMGHQMRGLFKNGKLVEKKFSFPDNLDYSEPWNYCQMPDRRFQIDVSKGLQGPDTEFLTNLQPTVAVPEGCYDTIDGFYAPGVKSVFNYDPEGLATNDPTKHKKNIDTLKRTVRCEESNFIEKHYRTMHLKSLGYRPDLYEHWTTGKFAEMGKQMSDFEWLKDPSGTFESGSSSSQDDLQMHFEFEILKD
ncbi:unnamed protein product [Ceutorhynchus assimilis]|uniref:MORN repeat-containing protein 5 n=1 Tax=Ceutorhynchus assimilis TaxID=467358 RepID=A0A9P0DMZ5_9CUCU|nr:unnamed protein product [Ceutorhynchus assimilis]